jgi:hypothetical protein
MTIFSSRYMKKAAEYRIHAHECRQLAARVNIAEQREQLLLMAKTWESLAEDREAFVQRHPELALRFPATLSGTKTDLSQ